MKLHTITYGCQMSVADGEEMSRPLLERGYSLTPDLQEADAVLLNTCTVRQHAEDRAVSLIGRLRQWKEERPQRFLIVAGCAAERIGDRIRKRFPYVDLVVGARSIEQYPALLDKVLRDRFEGLAGSGPCASSAYVTIMRGCNYKCSYCIVPAVRGPEINRPFQTILTEVRRRAAEGALEVTLLGQTVNAYRDSSGRDFSDLLRAVDQVEGIARIRFTSPHPFYLTEKLIRTFAECEKVVPHLHLPAQSGCDGILQAMRRNYTRKIYLERITAMRTLIPDLALTTDLIVGFPGETKEDFAETLSFADEADFCAAYCFKFSARETTEAAGLAESVPDEVSEERLARLLERTMAGTQRHLAALQDRPVTLLLENETDGRTQYYFKGRLAAPAKAGTLVPAVVTGATSTALRCEARLPACGPRVNHVTV